MDTASASVATGASELTVTARARALRLGTLALNASLSKQSISCGNL
jgi:hypothetical protein